jgi:hypothetical protein
MTANTNTNTNANRDTDTRPGGGETRGPSAQRAAWLAVGITFTVVCILTASLHILSWMAERVTVESHTYAATEVSQIEIDSWGGDVRVVHGTEGQVTVERRVHWSYVHPRLTERVEGDTLYIASRCLAWPNFRCGTDYVVHVPHGVSVSAASSSGDVSVRDVTGDVRLHASSGDVTVGGVDGDVDVALSSGNLRVDDVHGRVSARTSSGDITMTGLRSAEVNTKASSGDIRLEFAEAPGSVNVRASSGDVDLAVPGRDPYHVQVDTSSGDQNVDVVQDPFASRSIVVDLSSGDVRIRYLGT